MRDVTDEELEAMAAYLELDVDGELPGEVGGATSDEAPDADLFARVPASVRALQRMK